MTATKPYQIFQEKISFYQNEHDALTRKDKRLSFLRFILFAASALIIIYAANGRDGALLSTTFFLFLVLFGFLIKSHNVVKFKSQLSSQLVILNREELKRSQGNFGELNRGDVHFDKNHAYAPDLDIFGSNSLFQLIVRSRLLRTQDLAARWMLYPANKESILQRQQAVKELISKSDWRQEFTAYGMQAERTQTKEQLESFSNWMGDSNEFVERPFWRIVNWVMPSVSLLMIIAISFFGFPYQIIYIPVIINIFLLKVTFNPLLKLTKNFDRAAKSLKMYAHLFDAIETTSFESERLKQLKGKLITNGLQASSSIRRLGRVLDQLQNRANMLYFPVNALFLLDLFWLRKGESWKRNNREASVSWFEAVHEFEMLSDMASFAFANPDYVFPEIVSGNFRLSTEDMGHPLIHENNRITNSFEFKNEGFVGLITGSNMSGKSTFLRTVGLNLTMAQMGLPVCAHSFSFALTGLFTGMRTTDNLEESVSSFYAELARIKSLLDSINEKEPTLYLLDEILKGTNSEDRHKGSVSLIKQLNKKNAFGLISTHDLTLSSMEKENKLIENFSFNSTIEGDKIHFDYKLTKGPCRSFNASKLMEKMGIIVDV